MYKRVVKNLTNQQMDMGDNTTFLAKVIRKVADNEHFHVTHELKKSSLCLLEAFLFTSIASIPQFSKV